MSYIVRVGAIVLSLSTGSCAIMPDLPPDWALPMQEILLHSACELQAALVDLHSRVDPKLFDAELWSIKVTLNPKVDADIMPGAGGTRKGPHIGSPPRFNTYMLGGGNGVTTELRGTHNGSVDFKFDTKELMHNGRLPCDMQTPSYHALTKSLGIREWLIRSVQASWITGSKIDGPSFTADVYIKFNGNASYTYTYPLGTDLLSLGGYYQLEEDLTINFTAKQVPDIFKVASLPRGGPGINDTINRTHAPVVSQVTLFQNQSESLQQIRQQLQNLRNITQ